MQKFYAKMLQELTQNTGVVVVTIMATQGSVPRSQGTKMLVTQSGEVFGTIGGGDLEFNATKEAVQLHKKKTPFTQTYAIHHPQDEESTLEDSGKVTLNYQYLSSKGTALLATLKEVERAFDTLTPCLLVTKVADTNTQLFLNSSTYSTVPQDILDSINPIDATYPFVLELEDELYIVESPISRQRVLVYGSGHVGIEIVNLLAYLGFYVVVVDSRPAQIEQSLTPGASERHLSPFEDAVSLVTPTQYDCVLITTPNHDSDYQVLSQVLKTPAAFVGMLGSQRKVTATIERLKKDGYSSSDINRLVSPIGLPISAQTPEEIAVSVAAQFIQLLAGM